MFGAVGCGFALAGARCRAGALRLFGCSMPCGQSSGRLPPARWSAWSALRPIGSASFTRSGRGRGWNGLRGLSRRPVSRLRVRCRSIRREAGPSVDPAGPGWCWYATGWSGLAGRPGFQGVSPCLARVVSPRARASNTLVMYTLSDNKSGLAGRLGVQGVSPCLARVGFSTRARTSWLCISLAATGRKGLLLPGSTLSVVPSGKCRLEALARVRAFLVALWWLGAFSLLALPQVLASSGFVCLSVVFSSPAVAGRIASRFASWAIRSSRGSGLPCSGDDRASRHLWAFGSGGRVLRASVAPVCVARCIS